MDFSILDCDIKSKRMSIPSPYYMDFNIDRIMRDINLYWKEDVSGLYKYFPRGEMGQEYRKAIYRDICNKEIFEALLEFRNKMKRRNSMISEKQKIHSELQIAVMTLSEIHCYLSAVIALQEALAGITFSSDGMAEFTRLLNASVITNQFVQLKEKVGEIRESLFAIPIKLIYKDHFLTVSFESVEGAYEAFLNQFETKGKESGASGSFFKGKNPLGDSLEITPLEQEVIEIVSAKYPEVFQELDRVIKISAEYAEDYILQVAEELDFYLSFYTFQKAMEDKGLYFAFPEKSDGRLYVEDLYDLALACQLLPEGKIPVANDARLDENENFFVLSGPNQGGKTTFARSLGQLVYFTKIGLPVPARRAEVPFYSRILTHFSVEESVETGKGKLAEELSRLAPMMEDHEQKNDFVVINELFTTAANYDACIMGKRVLDHFIGQNCHGIYVTHLQDLSNEDTGIVSLRAMLDENNKQNFKIVRSTDPALESSILLVEKHHLHYEQVVKRLKGEEV